MAKAESELRALYRKLGQMSKGFAASRLVLKRSVFKSALKPKVIPDDAPLGGSLPGQILGGSITTQANGFIEQHSGLSLSVFQYGSFKAGHRQTPRPVVGLTPEQHTEFARIINKKVLSIGIKMGILERKKK